MNSDTAAILALMLSPGGGAVTIHRLLARARAATTPLAEMLSLSARQLAEIIPSGQDHLARCLLECKPRYCEKAWRLLERASEAGITTLRVTDAEYPAALPAALGESAPPLLFLYGDRELLDAPAAAVVGAREVSQGGALLAEACATALSSPPWRVAVVSGGAAGVDSTAHSAALTSGGKTIVVLPQGLLTYKAPAVLLAAVEEGRAAVLSEFAPDAAWQTHAAVTRNATISALARLVCVIEPWKTGGSVRTARCALEQGKRVLVHGGHGPGSPLPGLLRAGAVPLLDEDGQFHAERLIALWHSAPVPAARQTDLF